MSLLSLLKSSGKAFGICLCVTGIFLVFLVYHWTDNNQAEIGADTLNPETFKVQSSVLSGSLGCDYFQHPNDFPCHTGSVLTDLTTRKDLKRYTGCSRVFYNRVPKCGSRTVVSTFRILSQQLHYTFVSRPRTGNISYFRRKQKMIEFGRNFSKIEEPFLYTQHLHYLNFTELDFPPPVYINVIRDPVERVISHFYYKQYGSTSDPQIPRRNITIDECLDEGSDCPYLPVHQLLPFFCGQTKACRQNANDMLQVAKRTTRTAYLVVGLTEHLPAFMEVLENIMPQYFYNATTVFNEFKEEFTMKSKTIKKPTVLPRTRQRLKDMLSNEYDFYRYVKRRFYTTYNKIKSLKSENKTTA